MVVVLNAALQKREDIARLDQLEDELRLRLAAQAAGAVAFDWDVAAGKIRWDGATEILPLHLDATNAPNFLEGIALEGRAALLTVVQSRDLGSAPAPWARSLSPCPAPASRARAAPPPVFPA